MNDERRAVRHQRSDPITRPQPEPEQAVRQAAAELIEYPPRPPRIRRDQREAIRIRVQTSAEQITDGRRRQRSPGVLSQHAPPRRSSANTKRLNQCPAARLRRQVVNVEEPSPPGAGPPFPASRQSRQAVSEPALS